MPEKTPSKSTGTVSGQVVIPKHTEKPNPTSGVSNSSGTVSGVSNSSGTVSGVSNSSGTASGYQNGPKVDSGSQGGSGDAFEQLKKVDSTGKWEKRN